MTTGWSADEQANLLLAWTTMNQEEGSQEDLYRHFVQLCGNGHQPKSKSVVPQRKQTLAYVSKTIASYASLKPEKPSGSNGGANAQAPAHPWFRLTPAERADKFAKLKIKQYAFVDLDLDTFREIERLKAGTNEPPRSRQCNENTAMFRRFVSRCGGKTKRSSQGAVNKLDTVMNMVGVITVFNQVRKESCTVCFGSSNWFRFTPAERKAYFDELNASSHRYIEVDEELYEEAEPVLRKRESSETFSSEDQPPPGVAANERSSVANLLPAAAPKTLTPATTATTDSEEKENEPIFAETPSTEWQQIEARENRASSVATTTSAGSCSDGNGQENGAPESIDRRDDPVQDRASDPPVLLAWKAALEKDVAGIKSALEQAHMRSEAVEQLLAETQESDKKRKRDDEQAILGLKARLDEQWRSDHEYLEGATQKIQKIHAENALLIKQLQVEQSEQRQMLIRMKKRLCNDDEERPALAAQVQRLREERRADLRAQIQLLKERLDDEREGERRENGQRSRY